MNKPESCAVPPSATSALAGFDHADSYVADYNGAHSALALSRIVFDGGPSWFAPLFRLRNALVKPFGLKTSAPKGPTAEPPIALFPVQSVQENHAVLGFDDKHLDFRIVAQTAALPNGNTRLVMTTLVRRHNLLGRVYLVFILPFHRLIVPAFMAGGQRLSLTLSCKS